MSISSCDIHVLFSGRPFGRHLEYLNFSKSDKVALLRFGFYDPEYPCIDPKMEILCQLQAEISMFCLSAAILDAILNISIFPRVTRWHSSDLDSMTPKTHVQTQKWRFYVNYKLRYACFVILAAILDAILYFAINTVPTYVLTFNGCLIPNSKVKINKYSLYVLV